METLPIYGASWLIDMGDKKKLRVLSGIQPTGELHLGNYFGMMSRMIEYQNNSDLFCCIVNYHALTTIQDKNTLKNTTKVYRNLG